MSKCLVFILVLALDIAVLRAIPQARRWLRYVWKSVLLLVYSVFVIFWTESPIHPVISTDNLPNEFLLHILVCYWWFSMARWIISSIALSRRFQEKSSENRILYDIIAFSIYICAGLSILTFVFKLPLQALVTTSGVIAIVLGLALQNTLGDVFSGLSLSFEKPFQIGDEILLEGGMGGRVIQINWRSTHLENTKHDVVIIPHSAMAKMRIQNHSRLSLNHRASITFGIDSRNEPEVAMEILKHAAMSCPAVLSNPPPTVLATDYLEDRINYKVLFSTATVLQVDVAQSQIAAQIHKRSRPRKVLLRKRGIFFFDEDKLLDHLAVFDPLTPEEKTHLNLKMGRTTFQPGDRLTKQGTPLDSVYFLFSGVVQVNRQVQDGRDLEVRKLGPGDSFGEVALLTGAPAGATLTALTSGLMLSLCSSELKPLLTSRPELAELFSISANRYQQLYKRFDREALQPMEEIESTDLLSRIKHFFKLQ